MKKWIFKFCEFILGYKILNKKYYDELIENICSDRVRVIKTEKPKEYQDKIVFIHDNIKVVDGFKFFNSTLNVGEGKTVKNCFFGSSDLPLN